MGGYGNVEEMMIRLNVHDVADEEQEDDDDSERDSDGDYDSKGTDGGGDQNDSDGDYDSNGTGGGGGDQNNSDADYESNGTGGGDQNDSDGDNDSNGTSGGGGGGDNSGSDDDMMCGSGNDESDGGDQGAGSDNGGGGGGDDGDGDANADGSDDGDDDRGDGGNDSGDGDGNGGNDPAGGGDDDDLLIFSQVSDADATESSSDSVEMMGDDEEFAQAFAYEDEDAWIPVHALRPDMHVDMRDRMIRRLRQSWCLRKAGGHPSVDFYYEEALRRLETAVRRLMRRLRARTMWVPRDNHIEFQTLLQEPGIILLPTSFDQFLTRSLTRIAVIQE